MKKNTKKDKKTSQLVRFAGYYKPFIGILMLDLLCAAMFAVSGLMFPMLTRYLLNNIIGPEKEFMLWLLVAVTCGMVGLKLLETGCRYFMITVGHIMGAKFEANLRSLLFGKLLVLPATYYDNHKVGDLMSRVNNDLFEITEFSHHCPEELFIAAIKIVGVFAYLSTIDIFLTLIVFAGLPFMVVFAVIYNKRLRASFRATRKQVAEINAQLEDSLSGMSVVRSFANEGIEREKFEKNNREFIRVKRKNYKNMGGFHANLSMFSGFLYILTVAVGAYWTVLGRVDVVDIITYVLYVNMLLQSVESIMMYTEQFQSGMSGFSRFLEIMDQKVVLGDSEGAAEHFKAKGDLEFDNVTFGYEGTEKPVLKNLNLSVSAGENIALVGPSGAGKTTIANLIPRFYDVAGGEIKLDGVPLKDIRLKTLRENIGVVQQNVYLFSGTVKENILYGKPDADDREVTEAAKRAGAHEFISKLPEGYDTYCGEKGLKLSGGQKQRISIARLFLKNPPVLVLDEATSALDNESERIVQQALFELAKNRTTIVIAHRLTTIKNADKIYVITEEGISESGTHDQLVARDGLYASLYKLYDKI